MESFKGRHGTASMARLAGHSWQGATHIRGTAATTILGRISVLAQHGTVKVLHAADAAVFIDARSPEEFAAGHIPGAVSLPFDLVYEDPTLLEQLETGDRPIVTYCDGSECDLAENLAFVLIDAGHRKVLVYEGGTLAWTAAGENLSTGGGN